MRKEVWFGLSIMAAVVIMVFVLMPAPSQMTKLLPASSVTSSARLCSSGVASSTGNADTVHILADGEP